MTIKINLTEDDYKALIEACLKLGSVINQDFIRDDIKAAYKIIYKLLGVNNGNK